MYGTLRTRFLEVTPFQGVARKFDGRGGFVEAEESNMRAAAMAVVVAAHVVLAAAQQFNET